jgi:hypothetical protein
MTLARLYEWTKKQHEMPRVPQVGNSEHKPQPLSEMSHTHRDFFGCVPPPSYERIEASTDKKCYNETTVQTLHYPKSCMIMLEDESTK